MQAINLIELIPRCHAGSCAKGFWDVTPNRSQQLMLVVSELAEALEADRKGREVTCHADHFAPMLAQMGNPADGARELFERAIKDTPADELADAYIRLCDFVGGYGLDIEEVAAEHETLECPENFGEALLGITAVICMTDYELDMAERTVGMALAHIEVLCQKRDIDLATHIDLKLAYNATRPAKHGKAY